MPLLLKHALTALRCTVSAVGFLLPVTFPVYLIAAHANTCNQGDDSAYAMALTFGPGTLLVSSLLIWVGRPWRAGLRWLFVPHLFVLIIPLALMLPYLVDVTVTGHYICYAGAIQGSASFETHPVWHRLYAPVLILSVLAFFVSAWYFGRAPVRPQK